MNTEMHTWLANELTAKHVNSVVLFGFDSLDTLRHLTGLPTLQTLSIVESDLKRRHLIQQELMPNNPHLQIHWGSLIYYDSHWKRQDAIVLTNSWYAYELPRLERILHTLLHDYFPKYLILSLPEEESGWTRQQFHQFCFHVNLHNIYYIQFETIKSAQTTVTHTAVFTRKEPPEK